MTLKLLRKDSSGKSGSSNRLPIIAIDGPAGAGKSTAARWLAYQLGFRLIDTGALYRCLALQAIERNISFGDGPALALLCSKLKFQFSKLEKSVRGDGDTPKLRVYCDEVDVTDSIRSLELGMAASNISKLPEVRDALLDVQRNFGVEGGIVMEGRDIGTVIFPQADLKFYLTASLESRSTRRLEELNATGVVKDLATVMRETKARDDQDMNRSVAPLKKADDAVLIDSSSRSLEDVVSEMARLVRNQLQS